MEATIRRQLASLAVLVVLAAASFAILAPAAGAAFVPSASSPRRECSSRYEHTATWRPKPQVTTSLAAGGFEWEDPAEAFDQRVDNPFKKNTDILTTSSSDEDQDGLLKVDPARLLSPRMNGSNLYFIGMMGTGKSSIGKIVARRKSDVMAPLFRMGSLYCSSYSISIRFNFRNGNIHLFGYR
jgi:hypothetical protein